MWNMGFWRIEEFETYVKRTPLLSRERLRALARQGAAIKKFRVARSAGVVPEAANLKVGGFGTTPRGIRFASPLPS